MSRRPAVGDATRSPDTTPRTSFFRDLASAGFDPGQIIEAASEMNASVSSDINRYKRHIEKSSG